MAPRADAAFVELATIIRAFQQSRAVTAAAELGIADLLRSGARSVDDLAQASGSDAAALYRLLRALAAIGVFDEQPDRHFALRPMGEYLRTDHPLSLDPAARMFGAAYEWRAWGELTSSVRTGRTAAVIALDTDVWEYRRRHPEESETFDATMTTFASALSPNLIEAYDFGRHEVIADIGGGTGASLAAILQECPAARGVLFDQPHVVAGAPELLAEQGVADRVRVEAGDFFASVPNGADAYVLRRILHDWPDEEAIAILRVVRRAMGPSSRLIVVDCVVGPPNEGRDGEVPRPDDARVGRRSGADPGGVDDAPGGSRAPVAADDADPLGRRHRSRAGLTRRVDLLLVGATEVPLDGDQLALGVAVHTLAVAPELRVVTREQDEASEHPSAELLEHLALAPVAVHLPVRRHRAEVDDAGVGPGRLVEHHVGHDRRGYRST